MVLNSFNILFFLSILFFVRLLPSCIHNYIFILSGLFFVYHLSLVSFVFLSILSIIYAIKWLFIHREKEKPIPSDKELKQTDYFWLPLFSMLISFISFAIIWRALSRLWCQHLIPESYYIENAFLVGGYCLNRYFHVFMERHGTVIRKAKLSTIMAYLWYPCIVFSGPVEFIEDFISKKTAETQWKKGIYLIIDGIIRALIGEAIFIFITNPERIYLYSGKPELLLHLFGLFWLIHFRLSSYIHFTRGFSILYGIAFDRPNFNKPFSATSPIRFLSRWNASIPRFLTRYFTSRLQKLPLAVAPAVVMGFFAIFGLIRTMTPNPALNMLFGLGVGSFIAVEIIWFQLKLKHEKARIIGKKLPKPICILGTMIIIHLLFAITTNEFPMLVQRLCE